MTNRAAVFPRIVLPASIGICLILTSNLAYGDPSLFAPTFGFGFCGSLRVDAGDEFGFRSGVEGGGRVEIGLNKYVGIELGLSIAGREELPSEYWGPFDYNRVGSGGTSKGGKWYNPTSGTTTITGGYRYEKLGIVIHHLIEAGWGYDYHAGYLKATLDLDESREYYGFGQEGDLIGRKSHGYNKVADIAEGDANGFYLEVGMSNVVPVSENVKTTFARISGRLGFYRTIEDIETRFGSISSSKNFHSETRFGSISKHFHFYIGISVEMLLSTVPYDVLYKDAPRH